MTVTNTTNTNPLAFLTGLDTSQSSQSVKDNKLIQEFRDDVTTPGQTGSAATTSQLTQLQTDVDAYASTHSLSAGQKDRMDFDINEMKQHDTLGDPAYQDGMNDLTQAFLGKNESILHEFKRVLSEISPSSHS